MSGVDLEFKSSQGTLHVYRAGPFLQVRELNHYLEAEKSCRTDLEMYVAVLNTQKSVLQEDAEKLRKELHEGEEGPGSGLISYSERASLTCPAFYFGISLVSW